MTADQPNDGGQALWLTYTCGCIEQVEETPEHPWGVGEGAICLLPEHPRLVEVKWIDAHDPTAAARDGAS